MKTVGFTIVAVFAMVSAVMAGGFKDPQDRYEKVCTGAGNIMAAVANARCNNLPAAEVRAAAVSAHKRSPVKFADEDFENMVKDNGDREICQQLKGVHTAFKDAKIENKYTQEEQLAVTLKNLCLQEYME